MSSDLLREWNQTVPDPDYYHQTPNANCVLVVEWQARSSEHEVLFGGEHREASRHDAESRSDSGDSLWGPAVPAPRSKPKVRRFSGVNTERLLSPQYLRRFEREQYAAIKRGEEVDWQQLALIDRVARQQNYLRWGFYAHCYARLGCVGIVRGRGKKSRAETDAVRDFVLRHADGWPQAMLSRATGRSKSTIAEIVAARVESLPGNAAWLARRDIERGSEFAKSKARATVREFSAMHPNYPTGGEYWAELRPVAATGREKEAAPFSVGRVNLRELWKGAHPNSAIRRMYPTYESVPDDYDKDSKFSGSLVGPRFDAEGRPDEPVLSSPFRRAAQASQSRHTTQIDHVPRSEIRT
jgi:hypothetical protein